MKKLSILFFLCLLFSCRNNSIDKLIRNSDSLRIDSISNSCSDTADFFYLNIRENDTLPAIFYTLIEDINDYSNANNSKTKSLYSKIINNIDSLIKLNIPNKNSLLTEIHNYCNYNELEALSEYIIQCKVENIGESDNKKDVIIDSIDWEYFRGYLGTTKSGKILSDLFVKYTINPNVIHYNFAYGMDLFMGMSYKGQRYYVNDTLIALMPNGGFESVKYLISVWKVENDKYKLITVLDSCMEIAIGGFWIEDIISFDTKTKILIGRSMGGDEGQSWGSIWLGIWQRPRKFRIIYVLGWSGEEFGANPYIENLNYKLDRSNLEFTIEKTKKNFKWEKNSKIIIDSTLNRLKVDLNSLIN